MAPAAAVIVSPAELRRRVRVGIVIGDALGRDRWGDDLADVKGIGEQTAARLVAIGIDSFAGLAAIDEQTDRSVAKAVGVTPKQVRGWVVQATGLAAADPAADRYLADVQSCVGCPFDGRGIVEMVVNDRGIARSVAIDIFDAPADHRRSRQLAAALRAILTDPTSMVRVPDLRDDDVAVLRSIERSLSEYDQLTDDEVADLELVARVSGFDLTGRAR